MQGNVAHPFHSADFRWLWLGQAISTFGDRFTTVAIPILVYDITNSSAQLGFAFLTQVLAAILFGMYAGTMSDRWSRKRTMISADWLRCLLVVLIPISLLFDFPQSIQLAIIYLLSFAIAAATQFFAPAKISIIPQTVPKEQLVQANSIDQGTNRVMEFVGYAMAGVLIHFIGISIAFFIDACTFILSGLCIMAMRIKEQQIADREGAEGSVLASMKQGLQHIWHAPTLPWLMAISLLAPLAIGGLQPLHLLFVEEWLGAGEIG